ncbi:methionyl-tRNA formyltransferase [Candidatus Gottesmanbacteria bacterium]|nr:methionyl-tRNA formyltransferase [Candidatus Gottesmanbacteria bacterium]
MNIIFFGSTADSIIVLNAIANCQLSALRCQISSIITQPPRPIGRKQISTPTPVALWAKEKQIPTLWFDHNPEKPWLFADDSQVYDALQPFKADLLISASFGQKIPSQVIHAAPLGGLNVHPSLLPRWRGADPVPWAILSGDHQTGVTIVTLSDDFDTGAIIAQKKIPITDHDTTDPLRARLFTLGADLLISTLPSLSDSKASKGVAFKGSTEHRQPYANRLTRDHGFESWEAFHLAMNNPEEAKRIDRKFRAFHPWPGIWTEIEIKDKETKISKKRLKILLLHVSPISHHLSLDSVQLEGKKPVSWKNFLLSHHYFSP